MGHTQQAVSEANHAIGLYCHARIDAQTAQASSLAQCKNECHTGENADEWQVTAWCACLSAFISKGSSASMETPTLTKGARQLVVHEALEMMSSECL